MSHYETNPFADEEVNPFADPSVKKGSGARGGGGGGGGSLFSTSGISPLPPEPYESGATIDIPLDTHSTEDVTSKEKELRAKEAELKRREEVALSAARIVIEVKNWPAFFPIIHNDIANEIPVHLQTIMYVAFATLIGLVICLLYNMVAVTTAWTRDTVGPIIWLLAVIYTLTGIPGGFYFWYRPLYQAARCEAQSGDEGSARLGWDEAIYGGGRRHTPRGFRRQASQAVFPLPPWSSSPSGTVDCNRLYPPDSIRRLSPKDMSDSALWFGSFLLVFSVHIAFCILAAIAPELFFKGGSITGILAALSIFPQDRTLGMMYFVGSALFCCESLVSIWVIQQVFMYFRGSGKAAEMKREVARQTIMSAL
ncbi:Secretory carrier-associated membrane protein 1 [Hibiscus syriacus]|uniref:Secretory carrier-associated membrane protein n=1 Tax=Hibiscus syriacus TaxID=106335 RepID=A0A6A2ZYJ9_HIBSY|nr:Secretory carrier-associated membrane protein 1 [Hibiscus syriacus]